MNESNKKINYNPFKMWGSGVGFGAGLVYFAFRFWASLGLCADFCKIYSLYNLFPLLITGFLLGWAIHSLCRYIKNRGQVK